MEATENIQFYNYWCAFKRRWLPALTVFGAVVGLTYLYLSSKTPIYNAQGQFLFKQDKTSSLIGLDAGEALNSQNERFLETEAGIIRSTPILQKALARINENFQETPLKLEDLQQGLGIANIEGTDIMQVTYASNDPEIAALVVNQLMNVYVNNNFLSNRAATISAGSFIGTQLPKVKANVYHADVAVQRFKEKHKITDLGQAREAVAGNIERTGAQIDAVEAQLSDLNSRSKGFQNKLAMSPQQAMDTGSLSQSPAVQGVLKELQELQRKLADARSLYQEGHPIIAQFKDKEAQLNKLLKSQAAQVLQGQNVKTNDKYQVGEIQEELIANLIKLEVDRLGLVTQKATLSSQQALYQRKAASLPELEQQQQELERELSAAQSTYETLLKSLQEIKVKENQTVGDVRIIEYADIPAEPINASHKSAMAAGSIAGILIAAAIVYLLELTDKKIKTVKEARELFEYRLLSVIPLFNNKNKTGSSVAKTSEASKWKLPVIENPRSAISESYRLLQANLKFPDLDKALRVIVVTSSVPGEGKSTTCANLAAVIAQSDYGVLIIDADFRHPSQHHIWQISNKTGLMNVIAQKSSLSRTVIQTVRKNIDVLTAGVSNSDQDILLDSRSMAALIKQCPRQYEYVIIDTPPLVIAADATILGKIADGLVLVTRPGIADSINSKLVKQRMDQSEQNILGIVINGVLPENEPCSYYHARDNYQESGSRKRTSNSKKNWLRTLKVFRRS